MGPLWYSLQTTVQDYSLEHRTRIFCTHLWPHEPLGISSIKSLRIPQGKELYSSIILYLGLLCGSNSILACAKLAPCYIHRLKGKLQFSFSTGINSQAHSFISFTSDINSHLSDHNHIPGENREDLPLLFYKEN